MADEQVETGEQSPVEEPPVDWGDDISPEKDGGLYKKILSEGVGAHKPLDGDEVYVHYTGRLLSGEVFDSSLERNELFKFVLGEEKVIKGWDVGVATMTMNEKCLLTCKPEYAYGKEGSPPKIPPDSTLQFEVELFRWQGEDVSKDGGVLKSVVIKGEGYSKPTDGATCKVHICGTHEKRVFDERDVTFEFGEGSESGLVAGVEKAIGQMKNQEKARVIVKSQYGYGDEGSPDLGIPPNADLTYEIRLNSFQKVKQSWEYDTVEERRSSAETLKDRASNYFKNKKYSLASQLYKRGAEIVAGSSLSKDEEKEAVKDLRVVFHLNMAACHLKLGEPSLAIKECEEALDEDKKSVKAFFRRGQAHQMLQDHEDAIADFQEVLKVEPGNKAAATQIAQSKHKLRVIKDREKKRYANMFSKFADEDEKANKDEAVTNPQPQEGKGEEAPVEEKQEEGEAPVEEKQEKGEEEEKQEKGEAPVEEKQEEGEAPVEEKQEKGEEEEKQEKGEAPVEEKQEEGEAPVEEKHEKGEAPEEEKQEKGEAPEEEKAESLEDEPPGLVLSQES